LGTCYISNILFICQVLGNQAENLISPRNAFLTFCVLNLVDDKEAWASIYTALVENNTYWYTAINHYTPVHVLQLVILWMAQPASRRSLWEQCEYYSCQIFGRSSAHASLADSAASAERNLWMNAVRSLPLRVSATGEWSACKKKLRSHVGRASAGPAPWQVKHPAMGQGYSATHCGVTAAAYCSCRWAVKAGWGGGRLVVLPCCDRRHALYLAESRWNLRK